MDKRSEPRRICFRRVEIQWESGGQTQLQSALMEDFSKSGIGLRVRHPFTPGATIHVKVNREFRQGTVLHCMRAGLEYFIGVRFQDASSEIPEEQIVFVIR